MSDLIGMSVQSGICPQCGGPFRHDRVTVDRRKHIVYFRGASVHLSPAQAEIAYVLARHMPHVISYQQLQYAVWGGAEGPEDELSQLFDQARKAKLRIQSLGLTITCSKGAGYYMHVSDVIPLARAANA